MTLRKAWLLAAACWVFPAFAVNGTPDETLSALWKALSHEPGKMADVATLEHILHKDAVVFGSTQRGDTPRLHRSTAAEFLGSFNPNPASGFHECEIQRSVHIEGRMAVAYSLVESRTDATAEQADFIGANSIQLYFDGTQWKVLSLYYHVDDNSDPVQLDTGTSGDCIT